MDRPWFGHAGDFGDVIYGLCAMKAHAEYYNNSEPFDLYLFNKPGTTMHGMYPERVASIRSLLIKQSYIHDVIWSEEQKESNINGFRNHGKGHPTLAHMSLATLGMPSYLADKPWMEMKDKFDCDVIINRTQRYKGECNYGQILDKYKDKCQFVGFEWEWQDFTRDFGFIQWAQTQNLLEVGMYINGSKLFVGNQSSSLSLAVAFGKRYICEVCHYIPNCQFNRNNATYCWDSRIIDLPEI